MGFNASRFDVTASTFRKRMQAIKARRLAHRTLNHSKEELLSHADDIKFSVSSNPGNGLPYNTLEDIIKKPDPPKEIETTEIKIETTPIRGGVGISIIIVGSNYGITEVVTDQISTVDNKNDGVEIAANGTNDNRVEIRDEDDDYNNDNDNDSHDDERMIGYGDGEAFPGSPTFRIYFKENWEERENEIVKDDIDVFKETVSCDFPPKEISYHAEKKVWRERSKKCFRKVLPKVAVKNILSMKPCHHHRHSIS